MDKFFAGNPDLRSQIAYHIDPPDWSDDELAAIAELMPHGMNSKFTDDARRAGRPVGIARTQEFGQRAGRDIAADKPITTLCRRQL
jgi:hypothetical protein